MEGYVVLSPKTTQICCRPVKKNNNKEKIIMMNKMAQNGRFQFYNIVLLLVPFGFIFTCGPKFIPNF